MKPATAESPASSNEPNRGPGLSKEAEGLWYELRGLAHDHLQLAALETQQAGESLVVMIAAGIMVAGLLLSTWLGLMAALVVVLSSHGIMAIENAMLLVAMISLLSAVALWREIGRRGHRLGFPRYLRVLQSRSQGLPGSGRSG